MQRLTVTLETVTPLFLAGADPRGAPELRPPSFRGALRYWLRAALGGVYGDGPDGLAAVRRTEAQVFGSTEEKTGGAGAIIVRLTPPEPLACQEYRKTTRDRNVPPLGREYLYWSMASSGSQERGNWQQPKKYVPAGIQFYLHLAARPGATDPTLFNPAQAALWLLLHLGGVGSRARRTGGSLSVVSGPDDKALPWILPVSDPAAAAQHLAKGLGWVRRNVASGHGGSVSSPARFDLLHPQVCKIWVLGAWSTAERAIDAVGDALRQYRSRREPDHARVARWLHGQAIPTVERAAFGLPIPYRYSDGRTSGTIQASMRDGGRGKPIDRRGSPLWLKVSNTGDGRSIAVATLFGARFLPEGAQLAAKQAPEIPPPTDYALLEGWVREAFPKAQEVRYE
ncbi:MAG: type III-B CRISPR module RAMP protein Cmr1 [Anaerolineae bacterium]